MNFDTVHEYYFGDGCVHLHYCTDHETLIVVNNTDGKTNRLMLNIPQKVLDEFRETVRRAKHGGEDQGDQINTENFMSRLAHTGVA